MAHSFWDKQPVCRELTRPGIIGEIPPPLTILPPNHEVRELNNPSILMHLINDNFDEHSVYETDLVNWSTSCLYVVFVDQKPIGCVARREFVLHINGDTHRSGYVDWLTVDKKFRGVGLAPVLISHIYQQPRIQVFKKMTRPLPFLPVCKYQYFGRRIGDDIRISGMLPLTPDHGRSAHMFYNMRAEKFTLFATFHDYDDFWLHFGARKSYKDSRKTLIKRDVNGEVKCLATYIMYDWYGKRIAELICLLSEYPVFDFKSVCQFASLEGCAYMVAPNTGNNDQFIKPLKMSAGHVSYYHLYNYAFDRELSPCEIMLPFL
jgi:GNAT superfamily N-acetyltransferase